MQNNDRFKFRAWCIARKQMIYDIAPSIEYNPHFIDMQCTGLKDKSGKLIWEGDFCKLVLADGVARFFEIVWAQKQTRVFPKKEMKQIPTELEITGWGFKWNDIILFPCIHDGISDTEKMEVIGNIYEHPHLLEAQNAENEN